MTQEQRETIARNAIAKYGYLAQFRQLQEECAELIVAINHHIREDRDSHDELIEEIADVTIMLMQLTPPFNSRNEITYMIDKKLEKLNSKLCVR